MIDDREVASPTLSTDDLLNAYEVMRLIREFEERVHIEFSRGKIPGFVHLYTGQEAIAAGVCSHLRATDWIAVLTAAMVTRSPRDAISTG